MAQTATIRYAPCFRCKANLNKLNNTSNRKIKEFKSILYSIKNTPSFSVNLHGYEKSLLKSIDFSNENERFLATAGDIIEIQQGKKHSEFKFIFFNKRDEEPLHYVFLYERRKGCFTLLNVYNPTEGKTYKWSRDGRKRLYLNAFRSCCPHPSDTLK